MSGYNEGMNKPPQKAGTDPNELYHVGRGQRIGQLANGERGPLDLYGDAAIERCTSEAGETVFPGPGVDLCAAGESGGGNDPPGGCGVDSAARKLAASDVTRSESQLSVCSHLQQCPASRGPGAGQRGDDVLADPCACHDA